MGCEMEDTEENIRRRISGELGTQTDPQSFSTAENSPCMKRRASLEQRLVDTQPIFLVVTAKFLSVTTKHLVATTKNFSCHNQKI